MFFRRQKIQESDTQIKFVQPLSKEEVQRGFDGIAYQKGYKDGEKLEYNNDFVVQSERLAYEKGYAEATQDEEGGEEDSLLS